MNVYQIVTFFIIILATVESDEKYCVAGSDSCGKFTDELGLLTKIKLNDGVEMPLFGLGLWLSPPGGVAENAVVMALKAGYRLLDTAQIYGNEADVGRGFKRSGLPRKEVFIVSKVYTDYHGYQQTVASVNASLEKLQLDYVDLFLIHSPFGGQNVETYKALLDLKKAGKIRSVGVSNFEVQHLEGLRKAGLPPPSVNQFELHVFQRRNQLVNYCIKNKIAVMGYSPLARGFVLNDPELVRLGEKYNKTSAQIMIRWSIQKSYITIPKSVNQERIVENSNVFDFSLDERDILILDSTEQYHYGWDTSQYVWED